MANKNSFGAAGTLKVGARQYEIFRLEALEQRQVANLARVPYCIKVLLENLLRFEDGRTVKAADIEYVGRVGCLAEGARDSVPPGARAAAGFHRRARRGRSRRHARRAGRHGRRPEAAPIRCCPPTW